MFPLEFCKDRPGRLQGRDKVAIYKPLKKLFTNSSVLFSLCTIKIPVEIESCPDFSQILLLIFYLNYFVT